MNNNDLNYTSVLLINANKQHVSLALGPVTA